jgi:hypothetical protein
MRNLLSIVRELQKQRKPLRDELEKIERAIAALDTLSGGKGQRSSGTRRRRQMSAAGRRRIVTAQKVRWARWRAQTD